MEIILNRYYILLYLRKKSSIYIFRDEISGKFYIEIYLYEKSKNLLENKNRFSNCSEAHLFIVSINMQQS